MKSKTIVIKAVFTEPFLATASGNRELHEEFIASRVADFKGDQPVDVAAAKIKEEVEALPLAEQVEKASTVFPRDEIGNLMVWDYSWRGYFKECISQMIELGHVEKLNPWNYRKACDGAIYVNPRRIRIRNREGEYMGKPDGTLQRPLRATTAKGDRVALARSEFVNAGSYCEFEVRVFESESKKAYAAWTEINEALIRQCLDMGTYKGNGQWRSGGYGRFEWSELPVGTKLSTGVEVKAK